MSDVALRAGVSIKTVSNVVNGHPQVRPETRERVMAAIARLGYQVNASARNLRRGRTGMVGLALPRLSLPYFAELATSFIAAAEERGLVVIIEQTGAKRERELDALNGSRRSMTDGLIFSPEALRQEDEGLLPDHTPLVLLGERVFSTRLDHVTMRNVQAAQSATEYLLALGHRRIALVGARPGEETGAAALRVKGFRNALTSAGVVPDPSLIVPASPWGLATGARAIGALFNSGERPDALFCLNDPLAIGAMHALQLRGLRIPEDVAVVGFDDIEETQYTTPTLTSVHFGRDDIAQAALDLLEARIDSPTSTPRLIEAAFTIEERGSTRR